MKNITRGLIFEDRVGEGCGEEQETKINVFQLLLYLLINIQ